MSRVVTVQELAQHASMESCWLAISGIVYDVTPFLFEHPGGESILVENGGTDATKEVRTQRAREEKLSGLILFLGAQFKSVGHSFNAQEMLKQYAIGTLSK